MGRRMRKHKETLDSAVEFTGSIISAATAMLVAKQLPLELNSVQATLPKSQKEQGVCAA